MAWTYEGLVDYFSWTSWMDYLQRLWVSLCVLCGFAAIGTSVRAPPSLCFRCIFGVIMK